MRDLSVWEDMVQEIKMQLREEIAADVEEMNPAENDNNATWFQRDVVAMIRGTYGNP
jgi:hypothetical protein